MKGEEEDLIKDIEFLELRRDNGECVDEELQTKNQQLKYIFERKASGAFRRSRAQWREEGENSSKYFHSLEKRRSKDKMRDVILDEHGNELDGIKNILYIQRNFYEKLYASEVLNTGEENRFLKAAKKLSQESSSLLEKRFSMDELKSAISMMKDNKTPGPDGLSVEFYKAFFNELGDELLDLYNSNFENGELCSTHYMAVIRLVYKKGDRRDLKNWRPISLQNVDMKIISKMLAERLKLVLHEIIHVDQQGCIPGRYIGKNIRLIQDIINEKDDDSVILLLDQEKAFDRVEWIWLYKVLESYGFGPNFIGYVKTIYRNPRSSILTNGFMSSYFKITRGIRQGDALSALLYIIQAEPFAENIWCDNVKNGLKIKNSCISVVELKISQFVDDTVVYLENQEMVSKVFKTMKDYGSFSGAKLNVSKCKAVVLNEGNLGFREDIQITMDSETVLGIEVGKKVDQNAIWKFKLDKLEKLLSV